MENIYIFLTEASMAKGMTRTQASMSMTAMARKKKWWVLWRWSHFLMITQKVKLPRRPMMMMIRYRMT